MTLPLLLHTYHTKRRNEKTTPFGIDYRKAEG